MTFCKASSPTNKHRKTFSIFIIASLLLPSSLLASELKALVGGRLIDGFGHQPIANSVILIRDNVIEQVGTVNSLQVPAGYEVISTEGMDVLPGLWEAHAHLMLNGHANYSHWHPTYKDRLANEIMPASAVQLLLAGVTSARDLGAPLEPSLQVKRQIENGQIPGPRLYISGPFIQHAPYPGTENYRWGVASVEEANAKVDLLANAGVDVIKLIDHDIMSLEVAQAVVDAAHRNNLKVVGHSHKPDEIRRGLEIGIDNFEHTGLTTAPEYPDDIMAMLKERTAKGRIAGGPLFWTPTVEGLFNYSKMVANPEKLDNTCWHRGLKPDTVADIKASLANPGQLAYMQLTPLRQPTLEKK